jgi:ATP phosphoribosyltransferase
MEIELNNFKTSKFKVCLQREGHVFEIAKNVLEKGLQTKIPLFDQSSRTLFNFVKKKEVGIVYVKDKIVCDMVKSGFVDLGVVGSDRILEGKFESKIKIIKTLNKISWPLVIAIPFDSPIRKVNDIKTIATQFPNSLNSYFDLLGLNNRPVVIKIHGSAEVMTYGKWFNRSIDAIADISITGKSLKDNSLMKLGKAVTIFHPVVIANKKSLELKDKIIFFENFIK